MSSSGRRVLRPGAARPPKEEEASWEAVANDDAPLPPFAHAKNDDDDVAETTTAKREDRLPENDDREDDALFALPAEDEALRAAVLAPLRACEALRDRREPLGTVEAFEALAAQKDTSARHLMVAPSAFWTTRLVEGEVCAVIPLDDEFRHSSSFASTRELLRVARSPSRFRVVATLKELASECVRDPHWKAGMALELDRLAGNCAARCRKLRRLRLAKFTFEKRVDASKAIVAHVDALDADDKVFGSAKDLQRRTELLVLQELQRKVAVVDRLLAQYEGVPPPAPHDDAVEVSYDADDETQRRPAKKKATKKKTKSSHDDDDDDDDGGSALLDAILAMILVRTPRKEGDSDDDHRAWLQRTHTSLVDAWRDQLGVLPSRIDAILLQQSSSSPAAEEDPSF